MTEPNQHICMANMALSPAITTLWRCCLDISQRVLSNNFCPCKKIALVTENMWCNRIKMKNISKVLQKIQPGQSETTALNFSLSSGVFFFYRNFKRKWKDKNKIAKTNEDQKDSWSHWVSGGNSWMPASWWKLTSRCISRYFSGMCRLSSVTTDVLCQLMRHRHFLVLPWL